MKEPLLTDEAKNDLAEIWTTIADARDERTANRMNRRILASCHSKAQFPESGQSREEIAPGLRSTVVRPYVVFFRHFSLNTTAQTPLTRPSADLSPRGEVVKPKGLRR